jgi:hypothetical protein
VLLAYLEAGRDPIQHVRSAGASRFSFLCRLNSAFPPALNHVCDELMFIRRKSLIRLTELVYWARSLSWAKEKMPGSSSSSVPLDGGPRVFRRICRTKQNKPLPGITNEPILAAPACAS